MDRSLLLSQTLFQLHPPSINAKPPKRNAIGLLLSVSGTLNHRPLLTSTKFKEVMLHIAGKCYAIKYKTNKQQRPFSEALESFFSISLLPYTCKLHTSSASLVL